MKCEFEEKRDILSTQEDLSEKKINSFSIYNSFFFDFDYYFNWTYCHEDSYKNLKSTSKKETKLFKRKIS